MGDHVLVMVRDGVGKLNISVTNLIKECKHPKD